MQNTNRVLAIIPARGGSKRLPRKNILNFAGKPLIAWTIDAALSSKNVDKVIVSTDDEEIAQVAQNCGAEVPFLRPSTLSEDESSSADVIAHAIEFLAKRGDSFDVIALLQPTSPLRNSRHIDKAIDLYLSKNANSVISVCKTEHSPLWCGRIDETLSMDSFLRDEVKNKRSQDLPEFYRLNGAIYLIDRTLFCRELTLFPNEKTFAFLMEDKFSIDIDTELDYRFAEVCHDYIYQK